MTDERLDNSEREMKAAFEREIGVSVRAARLRQFGDRQFLTFTVGRSAPLYSYALLAAQRAVHSSNLFQGAVSVEAEPGENDSFPNTLEANALLSLLSRSTREVSEGGSRSGYQVPYVPFQNAEDHKLAQPATQIVRGRRGVGKSTLIRRAVEILHTSSTPCVVLDMQSYSILGEEDLIAEVLSDTCRRLASLGSDAPHKALADLAERLSERTLKNNNAPILIKREIEKITSASKQPVFLFLDDYHLVDQSVQPNLLHFLHACLKGANGWLKVAGLSSLLNNYDANKKIGLQVPGDAQFVALDLTLENPEAAENHLRAILGSFLSAVGHTVSQAVGHAAFRRLVWATAGVPRDFLQMFARALEHAQRNKHVTVTLSDINSAIGEFGQRKMDDLKQDARNEADELTQALLKLESVCLDENETNAFLVRSEDSEIRGQIRALSDLRMVHLIHQSITPDKAGERYEAYIIDYSIFTGFRRRPGIKEMLPHEAQFKAAELRALPKIR